MCGICGLISFNRSNIEEKLYLMNQSLIHRGPDDEGYFIHNNVGLAMRRLSSAAGGGLFTPAVIRMRGASL